MHKIMGNFSIVWHYGWRTTFTNIICGIFLLVTHDCFALPEDKEAIIYLSADSADINQQTHHGTYTGHVHFDQGSTHLRANTATTIGNANQSFSKIVIRGNDIKQAHYWTLTQTDKPTLHAYADTIYVYPDKHHVALIGNARVQQGADLFQAPVIRYDTVQQHVTSESVGNTRTLIVIHPEKKS